MGKALLCICSWQDSQQGFLWGLFAAFPDQTLLSGVVSLLLSFACIAETLVSVIWAKLNTRIFQSVKYVQCFREREIKGKYILCLIITYKWHSLSWDVLQRFCEERNNFPSFFIPPFLKWPMSFFIQTLKDVVKSARILFLLLPMIYTCICILHIHILPRYKHLKIHIYCIFLHFISYFLCWPFAFFHRVCSIHPWK